MLDRDALYRRIHALPNVPHHGKGEQCYPITDAVLALIPEGAVMVTEDGLAAALLRAGDRVGMSREKYAAAVLARLRDTPSLDVHMTRDDGKFAAADDLPGSY